MRLILKERLAENGDGGPVATNPVSGPSRHLHALTTEPTLHARVKLARVGYFDCPKIKFATQFSLVKDLDMGKFHKINAYDFVRFIC